MLCYLKYLCWLHKFEEGPWPAPITEHLEGRLWTDNWLPDSQSDKMQRLQGCLCRTSQSHLLAKEFVITQMGSNYTKCRNPLVQS